MRICAVHYKQHFLLYRLCYAKINNTIQYNDLFFSVLEEWHAATRPPRAFSRLLLPLVIVVPALGPLRFQRCFCMSLGE